MRQELDKINDEIKCLSDALALTPNDHPNFSLSLVCLGASYERRFQLLDKIDDLNMAIEYESRALNLTPEDHPDLPKRLANLGISHSDRYIHSREFNDLGKAIDYTSHAIDLSPADHPELLERLACLGLFHKTRYQCLGEFDDLRKAMEYESRALDLTPENHQDLPRRLANLGESYIDEYERFGNMDAYEKAIEYETRAIDLTPADHPDLLERWSNLIMACHIRFQRGGSVGSVGDIKKAIDYHLHGLDLIPDGHPILPVQLANLGTLYSNKYQRLRTQHDLEKAIEYQSRALEMTPDGHPDLPRHLAFLGFLYGDRFNQLGDLDDLNRAILYMSRRPPLRLNDYPEASIQLRDLATSLNNLNQFTQLPIKELKDLNKAFERQFCALDLTPESLEPLSYLISFHNCKAQYRRKGELNDLEAAIKYGLCTLGLTPEDHPDLPERLTNLGASYNDRFERLGELIDLEKAIECGSRAVRLTHTDHPDLPERLTYLASFYKAQYQSLGEPSDIEKAIELESRALVLTPEGHPNLPRRLANLGMSYQNRFNDVGGLDNLEKSIRLNSLAADLTPDGHPNLSHQLANIGASYTSRYQMLGDPADLEKTIKYQERALSVAASNYSLTGASDLPPIPVLGPYANCIPKLTAPTRTCDAFKSTILPVIPSTGPESSPTPDNCCAPQEKNSQVNEAELSHSLPSISAPKISIRDSHSQARKQTQNERIVTVKDDSWLNIKPESGPTDSTPGNKTTTAHNSERSVLLDAPVSASMTIREIILRLVDHGCQDLTDDVDRVTFSEYATCNGGFGDVYRGFLLNGTQVAIKALRISMGAENPKHLKHAARELHTWGACDHPNVLQLYGLAEFRGRIGMVSPWMEGGSLPHYLEKTPGVDRYNMCSQISEGVSYIHRIGIIHGDLKGTNVLVSADGVPVLTDFGSSFHPTRSLKLTETTSSRSLTVAWAAPELFFDSERLSQASDVYALAMTIYEVMSGTVPYDGVNPFAVMQMVGISKTPPSRPSNLPLGCEHGDKVWDLLLRCWAFESRMRPSASEVVQIMKTVALNDSSAIQTCL